MRNPRHPSRAFIMTNRFICPLAEGRVTGPFYRYVPGIAPHVASAEFRLRRGIVTAGGK